MAHKHLPDGAFSAQWVIIWWALALLVLGLALLTVRRRNFTTQQLTAAALLVAVSFAISREPVVRRQTWLTTRHILKG